MFQAVTSTWDGIKRTNVCVKPVSLSAAANAQWTLKNDKAVASIYSAATYTTEETSSESFNLSDSNSIPMECTNILSESSLSTPGKIHRRGCTHDDEHKDLVRDLTPFSWFPGDLNLSCLGDCQEISLSDSQCWGKLFVPAPQRMVRESCIRHLRLHFSNGQTKKSSNTNGSVDVNLLHLHANCDTSRATLSNRSKVEQLANELLQGGDYDGALAIGDFTLKAYQVKDKHSAVVSTLTGQLALLCLAAGRSREAAHYSAEAVQSLPVLSKPTQTQVETAVNVLLNHGLVQFGLNKLGQAVKSWREAIHKAISVKGYQDTTVAILLNHIGVLHMESGDLQSSLRSLEDSLELQRTILGSSIETKLSDCADAAIYRLATTMSNLAVVCERNDTIDSAISFFDEAVVFYESTQADTSGIEMVVHRHIERLLAEQEKRQHEEETALTSLHEYKNSRYSSQFHETTPTSYPLNLEISFSSAAQLSLDESDDQKSSNDTDLDDIDGRSEALFGNFDGVPSRRIDTKWAKELSNNNDFLLLGPLCPELNFEQRVHESVLTWFGKRVGNGPTSSFRPAESGGYAGKVSTRCGVMPAPKLKFVESIPDDVEEQNVLHAELHLRTIHKQAMEHLDRNEIEDAVDLFRCALRSHRQKYGHSHHLVGNNIHNIGMVFLFAKWYADALVTFEGAIIVRTKAFGPDHSDVQSSRIKMALVQLATGNFEQASSSLSEIRDGLEQVLGCGHFQVAKMNNNVGAVAYELGDLAKALHCFESAYKCLRRRLETRSADESAADLKTVSLATANSLSNMAFVYFKIGKAVEALELYERAYILLRKQLPNDHHRVVELLKNIDFLVASSHQSTR